MRLLLTKYIALSLLFLVIATNNAFAQNNAVAQTSAQAQAEAEAALLDPTLINSIHISGNQRVEKNTIRSFLGIKEGDTVTSASVDAAISNIFSTELFADVSISVKGSKLIVNLIENPIISEVAFEGNRRVDDQDLLSEINLTPRSIYTKNKLQHDVKRVLDIYQKSGRFSATVIPKVIQLPQNRVNLVFEIDEGERTSIERISFVGNNAFGDTRLASIIKTKESRWYRFLSSDDNFDPDRLNFDHELLRRFYVSEGYADFRVLSSNAELTSDKTSFIITYTLDEGRIYDFGEISIKSGIPEINTEELRPLLEINTGETFNAKLVEKTVEEFTKHLGNFGYAFINIQPEYKRNQEDGILGINFVINESPRVYVNKININGNVRTLDEVIRREFRIAEGDPYNAAKVKRSQERIQNLNFFQEVDINNERTEEADKVDINVDVQEKSTGELSFGAGFSTTDGPLGDISISERNLLGKGQSLRLNFTLASVRQEIDLSFTEPRFMGKDIAAGFDIFKLKHDGDTSRSNRTFDDDAIGFVLRASFPLTEHLSDTVRYAFRFDDITDINPLASQFIQRQAGENSTSLIGHSLVYDRRNNIQNPTEGYFFRLNQDLAGLGGDAKFFRNELIGGYYTPVFNKDWILRLGGRGGHIVGLGEDIRINDRFFIGGNEIRGFDSEGLGPRDSLSRDPLGGNIYFTGTVEVGFPLGLPEELGLRGAIFTDFGTLTENDDGVVTNTNGTISRVLDETSIRASAGVGISWTSPLGPIRIDISEPFAKESFDNTENVRFSFGTRF